MIKLSRFVWASVGLAMASIGSAQVAFSSFGPGDAFVSGGYVSGHNISTTNWRQTFRFQSALTGQLDYLRFAISHRGGDADYVVRLRSDNAGEPGTPIVRFDLSDSNTDPHIVIADAGAGAPVLNAGESYWFEFFTDSATSHHRFHRTSTSLTLPWRGSNNTDDIWEFNNTVSAPAFEVAVVPEPATLAVMGLGGLAVAFRRRRK